MRLLHRSETGDISLTRDLINNDQIPPYAILSHTWGLDTDEVTFEDITNGTGDRKIGYDKIRHCGEQAMQDGLQYFWVDTCCIDKSSSAELSEAINSMYRWYQRSEVCYVYLDDVNAQEDPPWILPSDGHLEEHERMRLEESEFAKSRWFTRGWTLQELLAPSQINFYAKGWAHLGDLKKLLAAIVHITEIDEQVLGRPREFKWLKLRDICVARRMSWAAKRQTTRPEDQAYCLMGIFEVHMPLLYGEGQHAFLRLQEEILKNSSDESLLAWNFPNHTTTKEELPYERLLAPSPAYFESCKKLYRSSESEPAAEPWLMSNLGLTVTMTVILRKNLLYDCYVVLDLRDEDSPHQVIVLSGGRESYRTELKAVYPIRRPRRIKRLTQRQLDVEKQDMLKKPILLMRHVDVSFEERMFRDPITVNLDITLSGQKTTRYKILVKSYYPSQAWNMNENKLVVTRWSSAEDLAAIRLTYRGDSLLLVLKSISQVNLMWQEGMERPILVRCPRGTHNTRSLISQIPKFLTSKRHIYTGPLSFQYLQEASGTNLQELVLKAVLINKRPARVTAMNKDDVAPRGEQDSGTKVNIGGEVSAKLSELYRPLIHRYGSQPLEVE